MNGDDYSNSCCAPSCGKFCIGADALFWAPRADGLEGEFSDTTIDRVTTDGVTTTTTTEDDNDPSFDWKVGFRLEGWYEAACEAFDIGIFWTHITGKANWGGCEDSFANWHLKYDVLDVVVGKKYHFDRCISFNPYVGIRGAWIKDSISSDLEGTFTTDAGEPQPLISTKDDSDKFWGIGVLFGMYGDWKVGCGFSIFGNFSGGTLYSHFDTDFYDVNISPGVEDIFVLHSEEKDCLLVIDSAIGIRWDTSICSQCFGIKLAWEQHRFLDFNQFCEGDLCLDGVTLGVDLCF